MIDFPFQIKDNRVITHRPMSEITLTRVKKDFNGIATYSLPGTQTLLLVMECGDGLMVLTWEKNKWRPK